MREPKYSLNEGSAYVGREYKSAMIRMVIRNINGRIRYATYATETGEVISTLDQCDGQTFLRWIGREATDEEVARLQLGMPEREQALMASLMEQSIQYARSSLSNPDVFSDKALLAEVERRGLLKKAKGK